MKENLDTIEYPQSEHPIIIRYNEMYEKVKQTLLNGNVVEFVNYKNIIGNCNLKFHFYQINQVKEEIKEELGDKIPLLFTKGFPLPTGILPINDFYTEFIKRPEIAKKIKEHVAQTDINSFTFTIFDYGFDVIRDYINEKTVQGDIISYMDCAYYEKVEKEKRRQQYLKLKEEFEND